MTERPFTPPGDDDLDAALRARRRLLPRFDTHVDDEPSPEPDRRVLSRAREALRPEALPERHYRSPRWAAPVAIAATVLLSLGLVLQMDPSRNDAVLEAGSETATTQATAKVSAEPAASTAAPEDDAAASPGAADVVTARTFAAPAPPAAPRSPPPAAPAAPAASPEAVNAASAQRRSASSEQFVADAPAEAAARTESAAITPDAAASRSATVLHDDPVRWLAAIGQLQRAGEIDAARGELAAFRRRYPDQPVPESLETLR